MLKYFIILLFPLICSAQNLAVQMGSCTTTQNFTITNLGGGILSGNASVSLPFIITSGASYSLSSGQVSQVWIRYCPSDANFHTNTVTFTGGGGTTTLVDGHSCRVNPLSMRAIDGTINSPNTNGNYTLTSGDLAFYMFQITNAGPYMIRATEIAPNTGSDSLLYSVDNIPIDPLNVWDMFDSASLTNQLMSARGIGSFDTNRFTPLIWNLSAGIHQLVIIGRESGCQLGSIEIVKPTILAARLSP